MKWGRLEKPEWAKGNKRTIIIPATAGTVVTNLSPGAGKRWKVLFGRLILTTDATAGTRYIGVSTTDGVNITQQFMRRSGGQGPSLTYAYTYQQAVQHIGGEQTDALHVAFGDNLILEGSDQLQIRTINGVAGDSYSGFTIVLEEDI